LCGEERFETDGSVEKAHILLGQSNFELAIKFLLRALEVEPDNLEARELVGVAELEGGDADVGREVGRQLLRLWPILADF
jgi:Flp pilus assembly protein TadD